MGKRHSGHAQRVPARDMTCPKCKKGKCNECVDVSRILLGYEEQICTCKRQGHNGEPRDKQVRDPFTGTVIGSGVVIHKTGKVDIRRLPLSGEARG